MLQYARCGLVLIDFSTQFKCSHRSGGVFGLRLPMGYFCGAHGTFPGPIGFKLFFIMANGNQFQQGFVSGKVVTNVAFLVL